MTRLAALLALLISAAAAFADDPRVVQIDVAGPITPVVASYVERGIAEATTDDASLLLVRLDTHGGRVDVTQRISKAIDASSVPVVVWVAPTRAMAASAGTVIVLSAHAAAMAPETLIGAASPVGAQGVELDETSREKARNVLVAQIRNLASRRGPRAEAWAEDAVLDAATATATEALELGVIDKIAATREELLAQLDGFVVERHGPLRTAHAEVRELGMTWIEELLQSLADPTVAFLLVVIGLNGVLFELSSPGGYVAGIVGVACLVLGFLALGALPVNYVGILLLVLAFALFVLEVKVPTHGVLTVGGIVAMVFGAMVLFDSPYFAVWRPAIYAVAIATGAFFAFVVTAAVRAGRRKPATGREGLAGARGTSRGRLDPVGMVMVEGELWRARAEAGPIDAGAPVEVLSVDGMELRVRRV